ncbi:MAG: nicotinate-nucleotide--dimethylbenzimidazole phosphoribosyltransferase [Natronospirillum sp.]
MSSSTPFSLPKVPALSKQLDTAILRKLDAQTKPPGSLGRLESIAAQVARIQQTLTPRTDHATHLVFAADHGVTAENISPYPRRVTAEMVHNFLNGGAAINVFCRSNGAQLRVVNAGVDADFPAHDGLINLPAGPGTASLRRADAMTARQLDFCLSTGAEIVRDIAAEADIVSLGDMGIGNTTTCAALMCSLFHWPAEAMVGAGTGANRAMQAQKSQVIREALHLHRKQLDTPRDILRCLGGFEIAMMVGAYLQAAALGKVILVDGFVATTAWAFAQAFEPEIHGYSIFAHESAERGHRKLLQQLSVKPLLLLNMRLGEGTGAVAALPLVRLASDTFCEMASFSTAGVSAA